MQKIKENIHNKALVIMLAASLLLTAAVVFDPPSMAAEGSGNTLIVTSDGDGNIPGYVTLRDALNSAEDGDVITFDHLIETVTLNSEISFGQKNITIDGRSLVTITKGPFENFRLLNSTATEGTLTLKGLTVQNGNVSGDGGGVLASGNVRVMNCTFTENRGINGGGIYAQDLTAVNSVFAGNVAIDGGGMYVNGMASLTDCTFINNSSSNNGGGVSSTLIGLTGCTFIGNTATVAGGGVFALGTMVIKNSGFAKNDSSDGTVFSEFGKVTADNTSFFANFLKGDNVGVIRAGEEADIRHCTFTNNMSAGSGNTYNIFVAGFAGAVDVKNCLMTRDGLTDHINGGRDISAGNLLGTDSSGDYAAWFGINTLTFNYIMPLPDIAQGATPISSLTADAAGNNRSAGNCLYGAVNWTAVSWIVTNSNDSSAASLRLCMSDAAAFSATPLPNKRVVYFDQNMTFNIVLTTGQISSSGDVMVIGHLGYDGRPAVTVDANHASRVINLTGAGTSYFYGMNIINGKVSGGAGVGIHSTNGSVFVKYCNFIGNEGLNSGSSGGGISSAGGTTTAVNCSFINNKTGVAGGAISAQSYIILTNCVLIGNIAATNGGGVYTSSTVTATDCVFINNKANTSNGGGVRSGGALTLTGCTFIRNSGADGGGAYGNAATVTDCTFIGNSATNNGGGIRAQGEVNATNSRFIGNTASNNGGGIHQNGVYNVTLIGCVFADNNAKRGSGAEAFNAPLLIISNSTIHANTSTGDGGAIDSGKKTVLLHVTITNNRGIGVFADTGASAYLYNCILMGNTDFAGDPSQFIGDVDVTSGNNLVEEEGVVLYELVFGVNALDPASGTHKVLGGGNADGNAAAITAACISEELSAAHKALVAAVIAKLNIDQTGAVRSTSGNVTYGASEIPANSFESIAVSVNPDKMTYAVGGTIDLTGTEITLIFTNGSISGIPYNVNGVTNNSADADMNTVGIKQIDFAFYGVTTTPDTRLIITVTDDTSTTITSEGSPTVYGQDAVFRAHVAPDSEGSGLPIGTVIFYNGPDAIGSAVLDNGTATLRIDNLPVGSYNITAVYEGDDHYGGSQSAAGITHKVNKGSTEIQLTAGPDPSLVGAEIILTATVSSQYGEPAGKVEFRVNNTTVLGTVDIESGVATLKTKALLSGSHSITAHYLGSDEYNASASDPVLQQVNKSDTSILDVKFSKTAIKFGETFSVTVEASITTPGSPISIENKTIILKNDGVPIYNTALDADGKATMWPGGLSVGTHTITIEIEGTDQLNGCVSVDYTFTVGKADTSVVLTSSPDPSLIGKQVTLTATVSSQFTMPSGKVEFRYGTTVIGTANLNSGVATLSTTALPVGLQTLTAHYLGNDEHETSSSDPVQHQVNKYSPTITDFEFLYASSSTYGQQVVVSAILYCPEAPTLVKNETIIFKMDGEVLGTAVTNAFGNVVITLIGLPVGTHTFTAEFAGSDRLNGCASEVISHTVNKAGTAVELTSSPNPSLFGGDVVLTARMTSQYGLPPGTIDFYYEGTLIGTADLVSGVATLTTNAIPIGAQNLTAHFPGNNEYEASVSDPIAHQVNKPDSRIENIRFSSDSSSLGQNVVISAKLSVASVGSSLSTEGMIVIFKQNGIDIGTAVCNEYGIAEIATSGLPVGVLIITAEFAGSDHLNGCVSEGMEFTVDKAVTWVLIRSNSNPSAIGISIDIIVAVFSDHGEPTGKVEFRNGTTVLGTANLRSSAALFSLSGLPPGTHEITAYYLGDEEHDVSVSDPLMQKVNRTETSMLLTSDRDSSPFSGPVVLTARVISYPGQATGTVEFRYGTTVLGTAELDAGIAVLTTSALPSGTHEITAYYLGDDTFDVSESAPLTHFVEAPPASDKVYFITATSDRWTKITPEGTVTVSRGGNTTFFFTAGEGHRIGAVIVDGRGLSQEEIDKGYYKFRDVMSNHSIEVISAVSAGPFVLTVNIVNGKGGVEYSVNGSSFMEYTTAVLLTENSSLILRAYAGDGYEFTEWRIGTDVQTVSEISFKDIGSALSIDLYFKEKESDGVLWLAVGIVLLTLISFTGAAALNRKQNKD